VQPFAGDQRNDRTTADQEADMGDDVLAAMTAQRVRPALAVLPDVEPDAIRLAYFGGRSYRQVAEDLDVPEGTIKSHPVGCTMWPTNVRRATLCG
jgi:DNA-directed RNA polymerase specialized sigma24 family protein